MPRLEVVQYKPSQAEVSEKLPGRVLFNKDFGRRVAKPLYYVFDAENLAEFVKSDAEVVLVCTPVGGMPASSVEQLVNPEASAPVTGQYIVLKVERVKE